MSIDILDLDAEVAHWRAKAIEAERANAALLAACKVAMLACQDNLKMYMYKNEPVLMEAFHACKAAIALAEPN